MISLLIPTCKENVNEQIQEIYNNTWDFIKYEIVSSCQDGSAAYNRNWTLDMAKGDIICMMDDDITGFYKGWLLNYLRDFFSGIYPIMSVRTLKPDGTFCPLLGDNNKKHINEKIFKAIHTDKTKLNIVGSACIMFCKTDIRFDENYKGATYEDSDFCMQMKKSFPARDIVINNNVRLIHKMEAKGRGVNRENWQHNHDYFARKWGIKI